MDTIWDGISQRATLSPKGQIERQRLADAAKSYHWAEVIALLLQNPELINTTRPDGLSLYAPLHQAAHGGAPVGVVKQLLKLGAWRALQNGRGERPIDIAQSLQHSHLLSILRPRLEHSVAWGVLLNWLEGEGTDAKIIAESWCRVAGGSGQRHEITSAGIAPVRAEATPQSGATALFQSESLYSPDWKRAVAPL